MESEEEHYKRVSGDLNGLFHRCRLEDRILLTTSRTVTQRRYCPECVMINVTNFQVNYK